MKSRRRAQARLGRTLVLDELGEGVAVGAEGEAGEAQVLALPRPEPLPVAEAGEAEERHSGDGRRHGERSIHHSSRLPL